MNRIWLVACACALALSGCMHTTKAHFVRHYALSAPAPAPVAANHVDRGILQIAQIVVPDWLDGTAMYYRLDYERDGRLASYANSDWIAPPAALLQPLLQQTMRAGGHWRAVVGPRSPASTDEALQIGLDDFSQSFPQPQASTGVLDATATLISNRDQHVIAQRHFHVVIPSPTPDAQGGAKALGEASAKFAGELQQWIDSTATDVSAEHH